MHKSAVFGLITLFLATSSLAVEIPESCLSCRAETSDASFMACLDNCINGVSVAIPKDVADLKSAGWFFETEIDPMTDEKYVLAGKLAENFLFYNGQFFRPGLLIYKRDSGMGFLLAFGSYKVMPTNKRDNLTIRIDKSKAVSLKAEVNALGNALNIQDEKILRKIRTGKKLLVQVNLSDVAFQTFEFDLKGSDAAYQWCVSGGKSSGK